MSRQSKRFTGMEKGQARHKGRCPSGKLRLRDRREAVSLLHKSANQRKFAELEGRSTRRQEIRAYFCKECNGIHITSLPTWQGRKETN